MAGMKARPRLAPNFSDLTMSDTTTTRRGRKPGYTSTQRKFGTKTKVVRVPVSMDVNSLVMSLEAVRSIVEDAESDMRDRAASFGKLSNRYEKMAELIENLRMAAPEIFEDYLAE